MRGDLTRPPAGSNPTVPNSNVYISTSPCPLLSFELLPIHTVFHTQDRSFTMKLLKDCWVALLEAFNALTGTSTDGLQQSLGFGHFPGHRPGHGHVPHYPFPPKKPLNPVPSKVPVPIFAPPSHGESPDSDILCDYTAMGPGWGSCSTADDRGCWLKGPNGQTYNIDTDYETQYPKGVTRKVWSSNPWCLHIQTLA